MTTIEIRKAQLREYIEACNKITNGVIVYGPSELHDGRFYGGYVAGRDPTPNFQISSDAHFSEKADVELFCKAANESARIAEQLLECIEALEYYGSRPSSVNIQGITIELAEGKETVGYKARRLLEKIAGEK